MKTLGDITNWGIDRIIDACDQAAKKQAQPEYGRCDDCQERPGTQVIKSAGTDTLLCDVCTEDDRRQMHRLPRFRNRDERDAWMAGSKARGEI
jgi:hypothetical protein